MDGESSSLRNILDPSQPFMWSSVQSVMRIVSSRSQDRSARPVVHCANICGHLIVTGRPTTDSAISSCMSAPQYKLVPHHDYEHLNVTCDNQTPRKALSSTSSIVHSMRKQSSLMQLLRIIFHQRCTFNERLCLHTSGMRNKNMHKAADNLKSCVAIRGKLICMVGSIVRTHAHVTFPEE